MRNVVGSALVGFSKVLANLLGHPVDFLTWNLSRYYANYILHSLFTTKFLNISYFLYFATLIENLHGTSCALFLLLCVNYDLEFSFGFLVCVFYLHPLLHSTILHYFLGKEKHLK